MADDSDPIEVVRTYLARVIEAGDAGAIDELVAADFINHDPPADLPSNREGLRAIVDFLHSAIESLRVAVDEIRQGEDGWVVARSHLTGRLRRSLFGRPAGADLRLALTDLFRVIRGRVAERREGR